MKIGPVDVYIEPRDLWVGYYRGDDHHYVCPLPTVVLRWRRKPRLFFALHTSAPARGLGGTEVGYPRQKVSWSSVSGSTSLLGFSFGDATHDLEDDWDEYE